MNEIIEGQVLVSRDKKEYKVLKIIPYYSDAEYIGPDAYLIQNQENDLFLLFRYYFPLDFNNMSSEEIEVNSKKGFEEIRRQLNWALEDYSEELKKYEELVDKTQHAMGFLNALEKEIKS
jgi:hypothetical protein